MLDRVPDREREMLQVILGHLYQHDLRVRRASVRVLHVQRGLVGPADHVGVAGVEGRHVPDLDDTQRRRAQAQILVELQQVIGDRR